MYMYMCVCIYIYICTNIYKIYIYIYTRSQKRRKLTTQTKKNDWRYEKRSISIRLFLGINELTKEFMEICFSII